MKDVGKDVINLIYYLGSGKKIFYVQFRNVKGAFPRYEEVFIDEGDISMTEAMKVYKETGFEGIIIPDHVPIINFVPNHGIQVWHIR